MIHIGPFVDLGKMTGPGISESARRLILGANRKRVLPILRAKGYQA